ncbi:MAG: hypothetical protein HY647_12880 [Acidobacteria bacterium]|nr:hypothetical protein [Acidobacteriota bacterium]
MFRGTYDGTRLKPAVRGSILLTLRPGTDELEGRFIEPVGNDIVSLKYVWIPKGS